MSAYNIIVNDVQKMENRVLCLARIDNYQNMLKRVAVGESIRTDPFQLNYHNSIGTSSWILIFYPKGQYIESSNSAVEENGWISMYLKMVQCEHESGSLAMSVKFFFKSPYCDVMDEFSSTKYATFSYRNLNERWFGPFHMALTKELYSSRCKDLFLNDSLTVGCELLDVAALRPCIPHPMILKENVDTTGRSYSDDRRSLTVASFRQHVPVLQPKENGNTASSINIAFKMDNLKARIKNSSNVDTDFNHTTHPQTVSKGYHRRATTSNADVNADVFKGRKNEKRMSMQTSFSAYGSDLVKREGKEHFCQCRSQDEMISKETQTWSEKLRLCSENADKKHCRFEESDDVVRSPSCCLVKTKVEFFEKLCSSKD